MQQSFFDLPCIKDLDRKNAIDYLLRKRFDVRQRSYESDEAYHQRILTLIYAFTVDYTEPNWTPLETWAYICPTGSENRLPQDKRQLPAHECYYLRISDISPENWLAPIIMTHLPAHELPKRATYKPIKGDVLLSRFKEPLGKCVLYT